MTEELKKAIERIKMRGYLTGSKDLIDDEDFKLISSALSTDKTLEVVKAKRDYYEDCINEEFDVDPQRYPDWQDEVARVLNELIAEIEGTRP